MVSRHANASAPGAPREPTSAPGGAAEAAAAVDRLVDECRVQCLWYVRPDYYPRTDRQRIEILEAIQERSDVAIFKRAGVLKAWLSRHSSDASASS